MWGHSMLGSLYEQAKEQNKQRTYRCVVAQWADSMNESDRAAFDISLNDDEFSSRGLFDLYRSAGAPFSLTSLKDHRNENCSCR